MHIEGRHGESKHDSQKYKSAPEFSQPDSKQRKNWIAAHLDCESMIIDIVFIAINIS
jgi:hypothetical protein